MRFGVAVFTCLAFATFCLLACTTTPNVVNNFCNIYTPIYYFADDTPDYLENDIDENNAKYEELCVK
jgi:hypothetical protein